MMILQWMGYMEGGFSQIPLNLFAQESFGKKATNLRSGLQIGHPSVRGTPYQFLKFRF